jgi:hypothetical protein
MTHIASVHLARSAAPPATRWDSSFLVVARLRRELFKALLDSYRPELHYMRGPGPRWREKHGAGSPHGSDTQASARDDRITNISNAAPGMSAPSGRVHTRPARPPRPAALLSAWLASVARIAVIQTTRLTARTRRRPAHGHIELSGST